MIITTILVAIAIIVAMILLCALGVIGAGVLLVCGDFIVFGLILYAVIKIAKWIKRKK